MSVRFDQQGNATQSLEAVYPPTGSAGGLRLPGVPVSVTLWIYLEGGDVPSGSDRATIWWFGVAGQAGNSLRLEAVEGSTGGFNLEATLVGQGTIGPVVKEDLAADAWHCVSVVLKAQGQSTLHLALYADADGSPDTTTGSNAGVGLAQWDTFSLARNRSGGAANPGAFSFEHAAVWAKALGAFDTASMHTDRIPPADGQRLTVNEPPDFSYWYCTAHSRSGIEVRNRVDGWPRNGGEFFNQSSAVPPATPRPQLRIPDGDAAASWDALTPVMRYDDAQTMSPIEGRVIFPPSRLQPHFWFFNEANVNEFPMGDEEYVSPETVRSYGFYHDPNMSKFGAADYRNSEQLPPPVPELTRASYFPLRDLAQSAKRLADWFEFMGLTAGKGTGADNRYAGCIFLRGVGLGGTPPRRDGQVRGLSKLETFDRTYTGARTTYEGTDDEIPLEQHPRDWVLNAGTPQVRAPWASWFREGGVALVREYMAHFWEAYKWELDQRGLCYPLRIHFDYEGWPRDYEQLSLNDDGTQIGVWSDAAGDARAGTERLLNYSGSTQDVLMSGVTADTAQRMYDAANNAFQQRWNGLSVVIRMQALAESVFADLATSFPETKWGNFRTYVADDPAFKYVEGNARYDDTTGQPLVERWWNTPVGDADLEVPGDFSTPVFFTNGNLFETLQGDYEERIGYSFSEVVRDSHRMRLDATLNARSFKPVAPTFENPNRMVRPEDMIEAPGNSVIYMVTVEDVRVLLAYAWQRGCDEFIMFTFDPTIQLMADTVSVCGWLRDWVHTIPQARQDRVGRVSRLGRRGM